MAGASEFSAAAPAHVRGRVAHYRVVERLGEGGMGVVMLAQDETLGRNVALKLLAPRFADDVEFRARFMRESRLAAAIDHPNIIPIFEAGDANGQLFIAMRYVAGVDLRELLASQGPFTVERTIAIVDQMARALDAAHGAELVHRDVKPGNVLIDRAEGREHCYLTDFGVTKNIASSSGYTETGQVLGTLSYMAPEQIEGRPVDGRADLYALGCVLFECLTGMPPFRRDTNAAMMYAHINEPPPSLAAARPDLPAGVDTVVMRALAKAPHDRHATCLDLVAELQATIAGVPVRPFVPSSVGDRVGRRFARPVAPMASNASTRGSGPGAPPRPAWSSSAPAPPPPRLRTPRPAQLAPPPRDRSYVRAAVILAIAILLTAGGVIAALLLRNDGNGPSRAEQQALLDRTNRLSQKLSDLQQQVKANQDLDQAQIRADRLEAERLIRDSNRQQAAVNRSLIAANEDFRDALIALQSHHITVFNTKIASGRKKVGQAKHAMPKPPPRTPGPQAKPNVPSTGSITLPDQGKATLIAPKDETISSVATVGDVNNDGTEDFAVTTDKATYVVFGGKDNGDVRLASLGPDQGAPLPGLTDVVPAGNFDGAGPDDLLAIDGGSVYPVTDVTQFDLPTAQALASGAKAAKAGDFDGDSTDDIAVADGNGNVTVYFGPDGGRTLDIQGPGSGFGDSLTSISDVNNDGAEDLLIGSPREDAAYVVYSTDGSSAQQLDASRLSDQQQGFKITGPAGSGFGAEVADLTGGDILVTAPTASPHGLSRAGAAFVIHARDASGDVSVDGAAGQGSGYEIDGAKAGGQLGSSAASAGGGDAVIGTAGNGDAIAYFVPSQTSDDTIDLRHAPDAKAIHGTAVAGSGANPVAGNIDFGGGSDLLVPAEKGNTAYVVSP
jgi:serine/threonine protein kinase